MRVFSGADLSELASFFAYDTEFGGGVNVAAGDVDGDGLADIITGAGIGGGPDVKAFSGADLSELASFFAFDPAFGGGVSVAAGDLDGDGFADIIAGAGPGGGPDVRIVSGADLSELTSFFAYDPAFGGGVNVATGDINGDGRTDLITGAGPGGGPHVRIFSGVDLSELDSFFVGTSASGLTVGSIGDAVGLRFTSANSTTFTVGQRGHFHRHDRREPDAGHHVERRAARRRDVRGQRRRHRRRSPARPPPAPAAPMPSPSPRRTASRRMPCRPSR